MIPAAELTLCDWQLALAAYAYEVEDRSVMTDSSYDQMSRRAADRGTKLPGFGSDTGQWINDPAYDRELLARLLHAALARNMGKDDLHGPAIKAALDECGVLYKCCIGEYECYADV